MKIIIPKLDGKGDDMASDRHLVVDKMKLILNKHWTTGQITLQKFSRAFHRDTDKFNEFKIDPNNRLIPLNQPDIDGAPTDLPINVTHQRWKKSGWPVIRKIKSGQAAEPDDIPAEALKSDIEKSENMLHTLFRKIWEEEQVPTDWNDGYLIKIPKKGDLSKCKNYRGITLLSVPGKVFNRILLNWLKDSVEIQLQDQQAVFLKDRLCTHQIATIQIIVEQSIGPESDKSAYSPTFSFF
ncbi:unnamed protein product [Schistosoma curassoni]|uniref:Reverse transcriptase domain-containing protein n=1 Tax=Schistosoma curassoni TaxID=6186 RepID=A0A183JEI3_9TREM|nr:unnamed protein product [Schistosoma curassoni]